MSSERTVAARQAARTARSSAFEREAIPRLVIPRLVIPRLAQAIEALADALDRHDTALQEIALDAVTGQPRCRTAVAAMSANVSLGKVEKGAEVRQEAEAFFRRGHETDEETSHD